MINGFLTIGVLQLLAVIAPGPDFAMVVKNTLSYSRRTGIVTSAGIASGVIFHLSYCLLGLAIVISQSILLFNIVKFFGAAYLIYVGVKSLLSRNPKSFPHQANKALPITHSLAYRQGFFCNLLNPKATLFFLGLFTLVIRPHTPLFIQLSYAVEIILITLGWFCLLATMLTLPAVHKRLHTFQHIINKVIGLLLIIFGTELALFSRH